ncbi:MAG: hypothetical protein CMP98_08635 [Gammaproteobacteria bacterium]|nr:hypothetical protein [Gammaproteobacteria bacterium]OUU09068.1 MAG: hypothetical protein CBB94_08860 [Gammaproteobacteria bacterium TMED34]
METRDHAFHINQLYSTDRALKDVRFYPEHYRPLPFFGGDGDIVDPRCIERRFTAAGQWCFGRDIRRAGDALINRCSSSARQLISVGYVR